MAPPELQAPRAQNPSPMVETAKRHERVQQGQPPGVAFRIDSILPRSVEVFIPDRQLFSADVPDERTLLVHIFSAAYVPMHAVATARDRHVVAVVNLGGSSSAWPGWSSAPSAPVTAARWTR